MQFFLKYKVQLNYESITDESFKYHKTSDYTLLYRMHEEIIHTTGLTDALLLNNFLYCSKEKN